MSSVVTRELNNDDDDVSSVVNANSAMRTGSPAMRMGSSDIGSMARSSIGNPGSVASPMPRQYPSRIGIVLSVLLGR